MYDVSGSVGRHGSTRHTWAWAEQIQHGADSAITSPVHPQHQSPETAPAIHETGDTGEAPAGGEKHSASLWSLFKKGGPFMWPILFFAALSAGYIIERFIVFKKANLNPREFIEELETRIIGDNLDAVARFCATKKYILSEIILKGLKLRHLGHERAEKGFAIAGSVQVASLERGLNVLSSLGNITPMLGFLGTVSGMIGAFSKIASADQVNARLVAGGIEEALLTTAFGLIVAIPTLFFYNYFVHRIEVFIADVEKLSSDIVEKMIEEGNV
jgi:biopolymer transport protein ExbB